MSNQWERNSRNEPIRTRTKNVQPMLSGPLSAGKMHSSKDTTGIKLRLSHAWINVPIVLFQLSIHFEFVFINCLLIVVYVTFSKELDETWQGMRWILDALHYARDRQIRGGIPLVEVFEYTVSHPDGQCCVCSSDLKGKILCNGHSKDISSLTCIQKPLWSQKSIKFWLKAYIARAKSCLD